jgi:hypothetical protein
MTLWSLGRGESLPRMRVVGLWVVVLVGAGCSERPAPPPVAPVVAPLDAGQPEADAGPPPDEARNVLQLPDSATVAEDPNRPLELQRLLLRDPELAERRLAQLETPSQWQVALLANFALRRGDHSLAAPREGDLPPVSFGDAGVEGPGKAWVAAPLLELRAPAAPRGKKRPALLASLPIGTEVQVDGLDGGLAAVSVSIATAVEFGETGEGPTHVESTVLEGQVELASLASTRIDATLLIARANAQPDTDAGHELAVALWYRALLLRHDEAAREGLLKAAWSAHRPSWAITAVLDRSFAAARGLSLIWGCRGGAARPPVLRWPLPRKAPADVCVTGVTEQQACDHDPPRLKAQLEKSRLELEASGLQRRPSLAFTVDARLPRDAFLAQARLEQVDPCARFQELKLEGWGASYRLLHLPLGTAATRVSVAAPANHGVEYELISAAGQAKVAAWLRSRSHVRWTLGRNGELEVSLQNGDTGFRLEPDVSAVTWAAEPLRSCDCNQD